MYRPLACLLLLSGCAGTAAIDPAPSTPRTGYRAIGTEPFWSVTLADGRIIYDDVEKRRIDVAAPPARPSLNGERYVTDRLTLDITHAPCSDGMSDRRYPDTVRVMADGRELKGCGMPADTNDPLTGTTWRLNAINGDTPPASNPATLSFADGRIRGTTGCNRLNGGYTLDGDRLNFGGVATTRMACPGPAMTQEARILAILREPLTVVRGKDGVMLQAASGGTLTLVPDRP